MNDFTHPVGPCVILPNSPLGIFQLFFTMEVIELIVEQTNLYAYQCMGDTASDIDGYSEAPLFIGLLKE